MGEAERHSLSSEEFHNAASFVGVVVCCHLPNATELQHLRVRGGAVGTLGYVQDCRQLQRNFKLQLCALGDQLHSQRTVLPPTG